MGDNPLWAELDKHRRPVTLRGTAAPVFGILTLLSPALALTVLVLFWGAYALVDGAFALIAAFNIRSDGQFSWSLALVGMTGVAAGLVTFFWPQLAAIDLLLIIAGWVLAMDIFRIIAVIRLRESVRNGWWMVLSDAISALFGVLMIASPGARALTVVWTIDAYTVFFGVLLVVLALRLRKTPTPKIRGSGGEAGGRNALIPVAPGRQRQCPHHVPRPGA